MKNLFRPGQTIVASTAYELEIGGLYIFIFQGELTVHRLIETRNKTLIFKGDLSLLPEEVSESDLLGRVTSTGEPFLKFLSELYQKKNPRIIRGTAKSLILLSSKLFFKPK